jgi:hypothetical protein
MPLGTGDLRGKQPPERRTLQGGMKRKPGKQPGAPGVFLAWHEHPDKTEKVFPEGICPCDADLNDLRDLGLKYSHQVTDLPEARAERLPVQLRRRVGRSQGWEEAGRQQRRRVAGPGSPRLRDGDSEGPMKMPGAPNFQCHGCRVSGCRLCAPFR